MLWYKNHLFVIVKNIRLFDSHNDFVDKNNTPEMTPMYIIGYIN